jgi:hypothetical protein
MFLFRISPSGTEKLYNPLWDDDYGYLLNVMDNMTEQYESRGILMIHETIHSSNSITRTFATIQNGYSHDLIICDGLLEEVIE